MPTPAHRPNSNFVNGLLWPVNRPLRRLSVSKSRDCASPARKVAVQGGGCHLEPPRYFFERDRGIAEQCLGRGQIFFREGARPPAHPATSAWLGSSRLPINR